MTVRPHCRMKRRGWFRRCRMARARAGRGWPAACGARRRFPTGRIVGRRACRLRGACDRATGRADGLGDGATRGDRRRLAPGLRFRDGDAGDARRDAGRAGLHRARTHSLGGDRLRHSDERGRPGARSGCFLGCRGARAGPGDLALPRLSQRAVRYDRRHAAGGGRRSCRLLRGPGASLGRRVADPPGRAFGCARFQSRDPPGRESRGVHGAGAALPRHRGGRRRRGRPTRNVASRPCGAQGQDGARAFNGDRLGRRPGRSLGTAGRAVNRAFRGRRRGAGAMRTCGAEFALPGNGLRRMEARQTAKFGIRAIMRQRAEFSDLRAILARRGRNCRPVA